MVLFPAALLPLEWALTPDRRRLRQWLVSDPGHWVLAAAGAVLLATLVSVAFSPVRTIAIWGANPGWGTYGLYSLISYLIIFSVVATHLKTGIQIRRLLSHIGCHDPNPNSRSSKAIGEYFLIVSALSI